MAAPRQGSTPGMCLGRKDQATINARNAGRSFKHEIFRPRMDVQEEASILGTGFRKGRRFISHEPNRGLAGVTPTDCRSQGAYMCSSNGRLPHSWLHHLLLAVALHIEALHASEATVDEFKVRLEESRC